MTPEAPDALDPDEDALPIVPDHVDPELVNPAPFSSCSMAAAAAVAASDPLPGVFVPGSFLELESCFSPSGLVSPVSSGFAGLTSESLGSAGLAASVAFRVFAGLNTSSNRAVSAGFAAFASGVVSADLPASSAFTVSTASAASAELAGSAAFDGAGTLLCGRVTLVALYRDDRAPPEGVAGEADSEFAAAGS